MQIRKNDKRNGGKHNNDEYSKFSSLIMSNPNKPKSEKLNENELKQLENDSQGLVCSLGIMDSAINRSIDQLRNKLSKANASFSSSK